MREADVEEAAREWLADIGWQTAHGPEIDSDALSPDSTNNVTAVLEGQLHDALARLNPNLPSEALNDALRKLTRPEGVVDIFAAAGLKKPNISILSEEFLAEVRGMRHRNLAVELLQKLLKGEVATRRRKNVVQARSFAELLEHTLRQYQNRSIEAAQVIEELIALAKEMREADQRGEKLGLTEDELAFYDALETNDSAVQVLGDETLREIARQLVQTVRTNVTIDWTVRENVRANLRRLVRRVLNRHGYPPDKQEQATLTVLEQAEALSEVWATTEYQSTMNQTDNPTGTHSDMAPNAQAT